jgi:hypothetical protein
MTVKSKLERAWKEAVMPNLRKYFGVCMVELKKTHKRTLEDFAPNVRFKPHTSRKAYK